MNIQKEKITDATDLQQIHLEFQRKPNTSLKGNNYDNGKVTKTEKKVRAKKDRKLSEDEVRMNHLSSEKKRRENVRLTYDDLVKAVPDLRLSENRSELIIYQKTMNYLNWLYKKNSRLRMEITERKRRNDLVEELHVSEELVWELKQGK
ncbi:hypothetical protein NCAS_0C04740 [Naumovozyma castellii]|uniref:BHLH domain-containing protein n=1 Tax=Naumovozyma castellii TaxID=27288 RepID=G0VDA2_NAUCA|nr:hypothetical protein NCAS_0C04740 [Naumovozyma castellii CBS 4309]CCC69464.1 hypothetical protein NCAS_0C04740 [Naumovozyma castellii CBS 4309]